MIFRPANGCIAPFAGQNIQQPWYFYESKIFTSKVELSVALSAPDFGTNSHRGPIPVGRGSPGPQFVSTPEQIVSRSLSQEFLLPQPPSCELVMYKGWKESRCWIPSPPFGTKIKIILLILPFTFVYSSIFLLLYLSMHVQTESG